MQGLYSLGIRLYGLAISIAALFQEKASKWKSGRKNYFENLPTGLEGCIWIHCASLGEFEQGRPIIEALKEKSSQKILLTFFSPSGYEIRKDYKEVDAVVYLPLDTKSNARRFVDHFKPSSAIFVKYEVWHHFFREMQRRKIPHYMVSAIFRKDQIYFKPYGDWFRETLKGVNHIFCQDENSEKLLYSQSISRVSIAGDTRFDRVKKLADSFTPVEKVEDWLDGRRAIVAGSTWPEDEDLIAELIAKAPADVAFIIAPHEIKPQKIDRLKKRLKETDQYSNWKMGNSATRVLIVDTIGLLGKLYHYGEVAYIGGGFGSGIHNTLEAAVYGIPVVFGPKHEKFREAKGLVTVGAAFSVHDQKDFNQIMIQLLEDGSFRRKAGQQAKSYVDSQAGATEKILKEILN
ncbi:3-deoxy-D-manno-octulosonic acid transferase [Cryomorphaceae bacterium 1068]|nr:3-deoxy-D-manno-octulosonic acid transferase [Cryomorphaceae bacterium 1068]